MTFFLRHKIHLLVVFAVTAAIGLSGCADTFTGYVELEPETSTEEAASVNEHYRHSQDQLRAVPTPGDEMSWDTPAASQHHMDGDAPAPPLHAADSLSAKPKPRPDPKRAFERY